MLLGLPSELLLSILRHLSLPDLAACVQTCRAFKAVIDECENTVYRQAAAHPSLQLIPHDGWLFSDILPLGLVSNRFFGEAKTWKELCRRACDIRHSWLGRGPSRTISLHNEYPSNVHRIKVDEERGFFITTHGTRSWIPNPHSAKLVVADITDGSPQWFIDPPRIRPHAHCEYAQGFLVFDRYDSMKEIWRLVSDDPVLRAPDAYEVVPQSLPDERQCDQRHIHSAHGSRFKFVPHALIRPVDGIPTSAYRLVFPTLMSAGSGCLFMWDVRTGRLVERMNDIDSQVPGSHGVQGSDPPDDERLFGGVRYVDVNDKYAFVCGKRTIKVFRRQPHLDSLPTTAQSGSEEEESRTAGCAMALFQSDLKLRGRWMYQVLYVEEDQLRVGFSVAERHKRDVEKAVWIRGMYENPDEDSDKRVTESDGMEREEPPGNRKIYLAPGRWRHPDKVVVTHKVKTPLETESVPQVIDSTSNHSCVAMHVSPCGKHLAILGSRGRLLIIPYFERVVTGRIENVNDIMMDIQLDGHAMRSKSIYFAYEYGRIAVVTSWGLYIIHPSFPDPEDLDTAPQVHVQRVATLNNPDFLLSVSCLQMTSTAVWLNWDVLANEDGSVRNDYDMQERREIEYGLGRDCHVTDPDSSTVVSVDFGLGS